MVSETRPERPPSAEPREPPLTRAPKRSSGPTPRRRVVLAVVAGCLYFLGFAGFDQWYLSFFCLVPLLVAIDRQGLWRSLGLGLLAGSVAQLGAYYWLLMTLSRYTSLNLGGCLVLFASFCLYHGGALGLFAGLVQLSERRGLPALLATPPALVVAELSFPAVFPAYLGNALHARTSLIQVADLGGPLLVSFLLATANAGILGLVRAWRGGCPRRLLGPAAAALLFLAQWLYGRFRMSEVAELMRAAPALEVGIVQANMGTIEKLDDPALGLLRHIEQSVAIEARHAPDLLIWPETAFTMFLPDAERNLGRFITANRIRTPLVLGALRRERRAERVHRFNTAVLLDAAGEQRGSYDKQHLLPVAETLPLGELFPALYRIFPRAGRFTPGSELPLLELGELRIAPLICYEELLPGFVRRAVRAGRPQLLLDLTNDAWFGDTTEPWIRLALAKFRAVEQRRYLVRAANSGVSAIIDPRGVVVQATGVMTRASLVGEARLLETRTPYLRLGESFGALCFLGLVATLFLGPRLASELDRRGHVLIP